MMIFMKVAKGVIKDESNTPNQPDDKTNTLGDYQDPDDSATTKQDVTITKDTAEGLLKDDSKVDDERYSRGLVKR